MVSIKSTKEIELMNKAGKINYECHKVLESHIKKGITTQELNDIAHEFIIASGGIPSFLDYEGYPASICTSINEEVVHGIPNDYELQNGDIISIDIGVCYEGYHSDVAWTYVVGTINADVKKLLQGTKEALIAGLVMIKDGVHLGTISAKIESIANLYGLGVVKELVGHGVGKSLHEEPDIPNYGKAYTGLILKEGMTLAIEPMFTLGDNAVEILDDDWTIVTKDGKPAAHYEHTILVTKTGYKILMGD